MCVSLQSCSNFRNDPPAGIPVEFELLALFHLLCVADLGDDVVGPPDVAFCLATA